MILQLKALSKIYPSSEGVEEVPVFTDLNLNVEKGETVAVLGRSGSGKSTLLSLIAGLDSPTSGEVKINEHSLGSMNEKSLARFRVKNIGIIFQQFHLMPHLTAVENVSLPLELAHDVNAKKKALEVLEQIGLSPRKNHFPYQLSGGECQRVAIGRALVVEPSILLADEPTGNLDEKTGDQLSHLLFNLVESINMTLLLVSHNKSLANRCSRKLTLQNGKLNDDLV
ncbi:ABC transporter ATP-binding protein [bacterium]|nr:ABC transporter ATP-binding protein [bacterium]